MATRDLAERRRSLVTALFWLSLVIAAGLDAYSVDYSGFWPIDYSPVFISVIVTAIFAISYYMRWSRGRRGNFLRFSLGSVPMFIGAQFFLLGTTEIVRCPKGVGPFVGVCSWHPNYTLNFVGLGLFVLGVFFWIFKRNEQPVPVREEEVRQRLEISRLAALSPSVQSPAMMLSPASEQTQEQRRVPFPFLLGALWGFSIVVLGWNILPVLGPWGSLIAVSFGAVSFPLLIAIFARRKYHNTRGIIKLVVGEVVLFVITSILSVLYVELVIYWGVTEGTQEILSLRGSLLALVWFLAGLS